MARLKGRNILKDPKNESSRAPMPILAMVKDTLAELQEVQRQQKAAYGKLYNDNDFVFKRPDGTPYSINYLNEKLQKILDYNGINTEVTLHGLQHSTATLLRAMGFSGQQIQAWLRHADLDSTEVYAQSTIESRVLQAKAIEQAFDMKKIAGVKTDLFTAFETAEPEKVS